MKSKQTSDTSLLLPSLAAAKVRKVYGVPKAPSGCLSDNIADLESAISREEVEEPACRGELLLLWPPDSEPAEAIIDRRTNSDNLRGYRAGLR